MANYQLSIVTPAGKIFDNTVESLVAPGLMGSFGVLARHAPMVAQVNKGILTVRNETQEEKYFAIGSGILEVSGDNKVLLLSGYANLCASRQEAQDKINALKL